MRVKFIFLSNYINHHQIPFCDAMWEKTGGSFAFLQTESVEEERIRMGWKEKESRPYLRLYYEEPETCRQLVLDAQVVLFGGVDDESYIQERLEAGKPVLRYSERLYKTGQWKAVSPRGLRKKYHDHTRYRKAPVYLLCAGAYVASDFHIVRAYPGKMYCWGYFPETKRYDVEELLNQKGWLEESATGTRRPYLLWAARMIDWKHPELPMETAGYLKEKGLSFHMDIIGGGDMFEQLEAMRKDLGLEDCVKLTGFKTPEQVRTYMEKADIFLFTSDRQEGWGAVANEAMNSGCALLADHMIGAVPYLVKNEENGLIYRDGDKRQLFLLAERLVRDRELCRRLGRNAYDTITECWNAENAAERMTELCAELGLPDENGWKPGNSDPQGVSEGESADREARMPVQTDIEKGRAQKGCPGFAPCAPAPVISEGRMRRLLKGAAKKRRY